MFERKQRRDAEGFYPSGVGVGDIEPGRLYKVKIEGREVVLTKLGDQIYAFGNNCPHGAASLAKGSISRYKISCPDHGYCFDIRSGGIIWPEDEHYRLDQYQVKFADGQIMLRSGGDRTGKKV